MPDSTHRKVIPLPIGKPRKGYCRLCKKKISKIKEPRRTLWHEKCNIKYMESCIPIRGRCWRRDAGRCAACGNTTKKWEADHIIPLHLGGTHDLENLQTLCKAHHRGKSAKEAAARATKRGDATDA